MVKEIQLYLTQLTELRNQVKTLLKGLSQEALDWRPVRGEGEQGSNSMGAMAAHLAGSENFWIKEIIGRQPIQRNREREFATQGVNVNVLKVRLNVAAKNTEKLLSPLTKKQLEENRKFRDRPITVRWAILHLIEHMALHVGHLQLTRQLWVAYSEMQDNEAAESGRGNS